MLLYNFPVLILGQPFVCGNYHPTLILDEENLENIKAVQDCFREYESRATVSVFPNREKSLSFIVV